MTAALCQPQQLPAPASILITDIFTQGEEANTKNVDVSQIYIVNCGPNEADTGLLAVAGLTSNLSMRERKRKGIQALDYMF